MVSGWMKLAFFLISSFGYWEYFRSKHKIQVYFVPVFTISVQFSVLLIAGLLNCLKEAAILLHSFGFLLFLGEIYKKKRSIFAPYKNVGFFFFLLALFAVGLVVRNQLFTQIDNFTHWAIVVRNMLSTDRFPSFRETVIEFTSYPLGSSALIYFVCKLIGEAEHMQMWAQAYFMLSAILPAFSSCQRNKGAYLALIAVMTGFLFSYNIPITELLIDTLMPIAGMATALFVCSHCLEQKDKQVLSSYYTIPLLVWTMNIKHAAIIFVVFAMVLLYLCIRNREQGKMQWAVIAGSVLFARMLWSRHCDYVFDGGAASKHSMSLGWFQTILGDKTTEGILETARMALLRLATRTECIWIAAWILLLGILVWFGAREEKRRFKLFFVSGISLYGVYAVGTLAMYIFSMEDYGELLAFTRYMRSIDVAIYYMLTVFSGLLLTRLTKPLHGAVVSVILILLAAAGWHWQTGDYLKEKLATCPVEWRQELELPITEYDIQPGKRYLLCVNKYHHGWPRRLWRYNLGTGAVDQVIVSKTSDLELAENYDYVVILDEDNPVIVDWVQEHYPDAVGSQVIKRF